MYRITYRYFETTAPKLWVNNSRAPRYVRNLVRFIMKRYVQEDNFPRNVTYKLFEGNFKSANKAAMMACPLLKLHPDLESIEVINNDTQQILMHYTVHQNPPRSRYKDRPSRP